MYKEEWYIHSMEYYIAIKRIMYFATTSLDLEIVILNEVSQGMRNILSYHLYVEFKKT